MEEERQNKINQKLIILKKKQKIELQQKDIYDPFQNLPEQFLKPYEELILEINKKKQAKNKNLNENQNKIVNLQHNNYEKQQQNWLLDTPQQFKESTKLKFYQQEALTWMTVKEGYQLSTEIGQYFIDQYSSLHPFWQEYQLDDVNAPFKKLYLNYYSGQISLEFPQAFINSRGGILADEMGLGKTVMMLALVLTNPRPDFKKAERKIKRIKLQFPSKKNIKATQTLFPLISQQQNYQETKINKAQNLIKSTFKKNKQNSQSDLFSDMAEDMNSESEEKDYFSSSEDNFHVGINQNTKNNTTNSKFIKLNQKKFQDEDISDDFQEENQESSNNNQVYSSDFQEWMDKNLNKETLEYNLNNFENKVKPVKVNNQQLQKKQKQTEQNKIEIDNSQQQGGTLIIVPPTLIGQWQREIKKHIQKDSVTYIQFFGDQEKRYQIQLEYYDIVLTTYEMVRNDFDEKPENAKKKKTKTKKQENDSLDLESNDEDYKPKKNLKYRKKLYKINWHRIILDEAHLISNINAQRTKAILQLKGAIKWCLTGTPIQNKLASLYPPISFIEHFPWNQKKEFDEAIVKPSKKNNKSVIKLLQGILRPVMIRRTKQSKNQAGANIIELPPKKYETVMIEMTHDELNFYNSVFKEVKQELVKQISRRGRINMTCILALLTKMRQCCDHQALITQKFNPFKKWEDVQNNVIKFVKQSKNIDGIHNFDLKMVPIVYNQEGVEISTQGVYDMYNTPPEDQNKENEDGQLENQIKMFTFSQNEKKSNFPQNFNNQNKLNYEEKLPVTLEQLQNNEFVYCDICDEELQKMVFTKCQHVMCNSCWSQLFDQLDTEKDQYTVCPYCRLKLKSKTKDMISLTKDSKFQVDGIVLNQGQSAKINQVAIKIQDILLNNPQDKIVVFTYFRGTQEILKDILEKQQKIKICILNGGLNQTEKDKQLENFDNPEYKVFLSTLTSGNVGLNLVQANHCMLISPWWNPVVELQAEERIYRLGQEKQVYVYKFYVDKTIEIRIKELQEKKQEMIDLALKTNIGSKMFKPNLKDFMKLFDDFQD